VPIHSDCLLPAMSQIRAPVELICLKACVSVASKRPVRI
jgi:hypothetical protein